MTRSPCHLAPALQLELSAKQREAELNAEKLSLQSQIHWLTEESQRLQRAAGAAAEPAPAAPPPGVCRTLARPSCWPPPGPAVNAHTPLRAPRGSTRGRPP
jgi:hypothetical protein